MQIDEYNKLLEEFYEWHAKRMGRTTVISDGADGLFEWFDTIPPHLRRFVAEFLAPSEGIDIEPRVPRAVVDMSSGVYNSCTADIDLEIMVVDFDDNENERWRLPGGEGFWRGVERCDVDPGYVDLYFNAEKEVADDE